jgi:hypothetical protein
MGLSSVKIAVIAGAAADAAPLVSTLRQAGCDVSLHDGGLGGRIGDLPAGWVTVDAQTFAALHEELAAARAALDRARADLEDRKLVERAKGLLMMHRGLAEPEAYRAMQKMAMDRKRKLVDIARSILEFAELLGGPDDPIP